MTIRCFHVNKIIWILGKAIRRRQLPSGVGKDWYDDALVRFAKTLMHLNINKLLTAIKSWLQDTTKHTRSQKGFLRFKKGRSDFPFAGTAKSVCVWPMELHTYIWEEDGGVQWQSSNQNSDLLDDPKRIRYSVLTICFSAFKVEIKSSKSFLSNLSCRYTLY